MKGKLFNAPVENPQKVLDLGTGTGIWAIDFAEYDCASQFDPRVANLRTQ